MTRIELQALSRLRVREARSLFRAGHFGGAYYLAGYAVECALKACIARQTLRYEFPERQRVIQSYSHDLRQLLKTAGLVEAFEQAAEVSPELRANWQIVSEWSEQSRYTIRTREEADSLVEAMTRRRDGVLLWLSRHW